MSVLDDTGFLLNHGWKKRQRAVWVDPTTGVSFISASEAVQFLKKQIQVMSATLNKEDQIRSVD